MPEYGQYHALPYTSLIQRTKVSDDTFIFTMGKLDERGRMSKQANITVRADGCVSSKVFFKVEVDLFGLPNAPYGGHEVVVEFGSDNLDNNGTFFTDANGLDM